jgi:phospholipase C
MGTDDFALPSSRVRLAGTPDDTRNSFRFPQQAEFRTTNSQPASQHPNADMKRSWRTTSHLLLLSVAVSLATGMLTGCVGMVPTQSMPTVTLAAAPASITAGTSATLTWTSSNAASATINNGIGTVASSGSTTVTPTQTTTYTITVSGSQTQTATAQATVTVMALGAPTVTMTAKPVSILVGQSSTLTVAATNSTKVVITDNLDSNSYLLPASGGTQSVSPTATTIYTATATGTNNQTVTAAATVTVTPLAAPTVTINANPTSISAGQSSTLTVVAVNSTKVVITDNLDSNSYLMPASGGTQSVSPTATTIYTATATGTNNQTVTAAATVTVGPGSLNSSVNHIIFMMQENRTFDHYFGMLNPYRSANGFSVGDDGVTYSVDGIDDKLNTINNLDDEGQSFNLFKLKSTCIDDDSSSWLPSYGDVNRYDFSIDRPINMDGFVHTAEGYAKYCAIPANNCTGGQFTDLSGQRAMGYYDETYLNYYYYMASQFAISDRWFSPVESESIPNRIATMTGGTTQGLVHDPGSNEDNLGVQLTIPTIFQELDTNNVSWRIYYSTTEDQCSAGNDGDCGNGHPIDKYPAVAFTYFTYSVKYLYLKSQQRPTCVPPTQDSGPAVGDPNNAFCLDVNHIAPIGQFTTDLANNTLPSFAWIEPGYSQNDEHPGSGQSILLGQAQVASLFNAFMASPSWKDSIFFWSYDEGGGPYDHVPPVPGHTNDKTDSQVLTDYPSDISSIAVNPDSYNPCVPANGTDTPTLHCDLRTSPPAGNRDPGTSSSDVAAQQGFAAQLGFRLPNIVLSPFTRKHYVSHRPMDHTAVIKLVETRFIGSSAALTPRDAAQPDLVDFFDFTNVPWRTPPAGVPQPYPPSQAQATCTASSMGP